MEKKTSVVISTYNGEKYVLEQLESIRLQTKKVDEVIIKDDFSQDNTCKIIKDYIEENNLSGWTLIKNEANIGWKRNFASVLSMASGDYIFICDQDDIWMNNKVERMYDIMNSNSNIEVLVSNYELCIEESTKSFIQGPKKQKGKTVEKYRPGVNFIYTKYPGCVFCIKRDIVEIFESFWRDMYPHDSLLWHIANIRESLYIIHEDLIKYRRHSGNATGKKISDRNQRIEAIERYSGFLDIYCELLKDDASKIKKINKVVKWNQNREKILRNRDLFSVIKNLRYIRYYWSYRTYFSDIIYAFK